MTTLLQVLRFLRLYARPYWRHYVFGFACLWATNYIVVRIPQLVGQSLDILANGGGQALADSRGHALEILLLGLLLLGVRTYSRIMFFNPGRDIEYQLTVNMFRHMLRLPRPFYVKNKVGELVSLSVSDTTSVRLLVGFAGLQVCNVAFALPMHLYKMWQTDPVLTGWCIVPMAIGTIYLERTVAKFYTYVRQIQAELAKLSERILESFSGVSTVRAHAAFEPAQARFEQRNREFLDFNLRVSAIRSFSLPALSYAGYFAMGLVVWIGGERVIAKQMQIGELATFIALLGTFVGVIMSLVWVIVAISRGLVSLGRVNRLLETEPGLPAITDTIQWSGPPKLEVRGLAYRFDSAPQDSSRDTSQDVPQEVLSDISFTVEPGKTVGLFGRTGAGKSVLLQLLARVYEPSANSVFVNGVDVTKVDLAEVREHFAVVPQDPFLFSATLHDNIVMPSGDAAADETKASDRARFDNVVQAACLENDIAVLPQGAETMVGERGVMLSGGQRQRAAFARALYRQPDILLLDDILSAVDQSTESRMVEAIRRLDMASADAPPPTTVIVSHRTSVLEHADEILVLEGGKVVERGTHEELLATGNSYAQAYAHQHESQHAAQKGDN